MMKVKHPRSFFAAFGATSFSLYFIQQILFSVILSFDISTMTLFTFRATPTFRTILPIEVVKRKFSSTLTTNLGLHNYLLGRGRGI